MYRVNRIAGFFFFNIKIKFLNYFFNQHQKKSVVIISTNIFLLLFIWRCFNAVFLLSYSLLRNVVFLIEGVSFEFHRHLSLPEHREDTVMLQMDEEVNLNIYGNTRRVVVGMRCKILRHFVPNCRCLPTTASIGEMKKFIDDVYENLFAIKLYVCLPSISSTESDTKRLGWGILQTGSYFVNQ